MAKIDENHKRVDCAADANDEVQPLLVDPVEGRLLVHIKGVDTLDGVVNSSKIDENHKRVDCVIDDSGDVVPLHTDSDGYLLCDLLIE